MSDDSKQAERRATEDLLAGFDRPGRSPRAPAVRTPVDFHGGTPYAGGETVLVTRKRPAALWPWLLAAFVASVGVGLIVFVVILRGRADVEPTFASASVPAPEPSPPPPAIASVAAPPASAAPSASVSTPPPIASPTPRRPPPPAPKKPEHRGDFVPEL